MGLFSSDGTTRAQRKAEAKALKAKAKLEAKFDAKSRRKEHKARRKNEHKYFQKEMKAERKTARQLAKSQTKVSKAEAKKFAVEAQAAGVPVVATNLGAVPETVLAPPDVAEEARTGWRVPANDAHALALALAEMLALAPQDREALAARALAHVRQDFTVEAMCGATLAVYDRLAKAR